MIEQLFGSKTRVKLLQLFYSNPSRAFYVREITRKVDEQINSVRRELANLLSIGIITSESTNNRLYYEVNQKYEHYKALAYIFGGKAVKTDKKSKKPDTAEEDMIVEHPLSQDIQSLGQVDLALLTGAFTRDQSAGVDVLLVGDLNQAKLAKFMHGLEEDEGRELRYTVLSASNFKYRQQINDKFITNVLGAKMQVILDRDNLIRT